MIDAINNTGDASYIYRLNKIKVLSIVRNSNRISRAEIARQSGLSAPTISRIVEDLIEKGLIEETGTGESKGGRRPTMLRFSGDNNFIIGIDLGTTNILGVVSNLDAKIIAEVKRPTQVEEGFKPVMSRTSEVIKELKEKLGSKEDRIYGIGMAVAGLINRKRNIVEFSPNFHWREVDVLGELAPKHNVPIIFDNVTRVMALGEMVYGIGKQFKNFICVNVGHGIGAGIVMKGKALYGPTGMLGEFGHLTLEKDSEIQCDCGNFGCLEALASGQAIAQTASLEVENGSNSLLNDMSNGNPAGITAQMVADAAKQGDSLAWSIFDRAVEYLGVGIAGLINLLSPEAIVIGGGVAQAGDILFERVRKTVNARSLKKISMDVQIVPAKFGTNAAVMGAVALVLDQVLKLNLTAENSNS